MRRALRDVVSAAEEAARKAETQQRSSWFSWRRSSKSEDAFEDNGDEDDVTTDQIEELMNRDDEGECATGGEFLRVRLSTSLTCTVRVSLSRISCASAARKYLPDNGCNRASSAVP